MYLLWDNRFAKAVFAAAIVACFAATVSAQEGTEQPSADEEDIEEMEEVIVKSSRYGDPAEIQARNEELLRRRVQKDMDELRLLEEEYEWRKAGAATKEESSRIKWGYDPRDELEMRRDLPDAEWDKTKPATLFKFEF